MLGSFYLRRGAMADAEAELKAALRLSRQYTPAAINLADLYRQLDREAEGERTLREAIADGPEDAGVHHALGLTLVRLKRLDEAIGELRLAAQLAPEQARYAYVHAVALNSAGRGSEAIAVLKDSPGSPSGRSRDLAGADQLQSPRRGHLRSARLCATVGPHGPDRSQCHSASTRP